MARVPTRLAQLFGAVPNGSQKFDLNNFGFSVWGQFDNALRRSQLNDGRIISGVSAAELAFWIWRVKSFIVSGTITSALGTASGSFILEKPGDEATPLSATGDSYYDITRVTPPGGGLGGSLTLYMPGIVAEADPLANVWDFILYFYVEGYDGVIGFGSGSNTFMEPATTGIACEIRGTDAVTGETYSHPMTLYSAVPDPPTGTITIEPHEYFAFADDNGKNAFYDEATGAPTAYWRKWFATGQVGA